MEKTKNWKLLSEDEKRIYSKMNVNWFLSEEWRDKNILLWWINNKNRKFGNLTLFWRYMWPTPTLSSLGIVSNIDKFDPETLTGDKNNSNEYIDLLLSWTSVVAIRDFEEIKILCNNILKVKWLKGPNFQDWYWNTLLMVMILTFNKDWILFLLENYWDKINFELKNKNKNDIFDIIEELKNPDKFPWKKTIYQESDKNLFKKEIAEIDQIINTLKAKWLSETISRYKNYWIYRNISWKILSTLG